VSPAKIKALIALSDEIGAWLRTGETPEKIIDRLVAQHGASIKFSCGTNVLRAGGVTGTSTQGADMVLRSWRRLATLRVMEANNGGAGRD
jgi:hypothetical protein